MINESGFDPVTMDEIAISRIVTVIRVKDLKYWRHLPIFRVRQRTTVGVFMETDLYRRRAKAISRAPKKPIPLAITWTEAQCFRMRVSRRGDNSRPAEAWSIEQGIGRPRLSPGGQTEEGCG